MSKLLVAAGDYEFQQQVKEALGSGYYEMSFAYSHRDTLYMVRTQSIDAVLIDGAMFDRHTGEKTFAVLSRLSSPPAQIIYLSSPVAQQTAQSLLARGTSVFINQVERQSLFHALSEALRVPVPTISEDGELYDTSPNDQRLWRDDEIQTLFALSRSLTEVLDLNEVLHRVVQAARSLTDADEGILLMPDGDGQFYLRAEAGVDSEMSQTFRVKLQDSYAGQVFSTGEPVLIGIGGPHKVKTQYFVNSLLYVPISLKKERIGVLGVSNRYKRTMFNRRHQELLSHLASYSAIAIENARIHGLSVQRAQDLTSLVESSQAINSSLSMDSTLIHISEQLSTLLNAGRVDIYQWKQRGRLSTSPSSEPPALATLSRYRHATWRVGYAPAISLKSHPALTAALRNKVVIVTTSRTELTDEVATLRDIGANAMLAAPMMVDNQPLGLILAYYQTQPESPPSLDVIQKVQNIGIEILSSMVQSTETQHAPLFQRAQSVIDLLGASWVEFTLLGQDRRSLLVLISVGVSIWLKQSYSDQTLAEFSAALSMLREQQSIHASADGDTSTLGSLAMLNALGGRAMLGIPLISQGEVIGFMLAIDTERSRQFSDREMNLARALASQASAAMQNADLLRQLEVSYQELKTAQERLVRAARLSAMGELAGAVAHQINNPLTTIVLDAELLLLNPKIEGKSRESLDAILRSGKRAASVVRRLLTTVQPDRSDNAAPVNISETVEETLALVRTHVQREGILVRLSLETEAPPFVFALREDLNDLWLNLMLNAHDSLTGRKDAEMGVVVRFQQTDDHVEVVVWDNGIGIPEENMDRIFEPFFTTKPAGEGTGLGLHICRQIIDRLGGSVRVNSQVNVGTSFIVRLPVAKE